jgi:hypothetical protein
MTPVLVNQPLGPLTHRVTGSLASVDPRGLLIGMTQLRHNLCVRGAGLREF